MSDSITCPVCKTTDVMELGTEETSSKIDSRHEHNPIKKKTYYECATGHRWRTSRLTSCGVEGCSYGKIPQVVIFGNQRAFEGEMRA